jgi:hypothetical protein
VADGSGILHQPGDVFTMPDKNVDLYAQWSADQTDPDPVVQETVQMSYVPVPGGGIYFPTGWDDDLVLHVDGPYYVSETLVTYRLWNAVYTWATSDDRGIGKYTFGNPGRQGGDYQSWDLENGNNESPDTPVGDDLHPVTKVTLLDALVWCNALTEWHNEYHGTNYGKVYLHGGEDSSTKQVRLLGANSLSLFDYVSFGLTNSKAVSYIGFLVVRSGP